MSSSLLRYRYVLMLALWGGILNLHARGPLFTPGFEGPAALDAFPRVELSNNLLGAISKGDSSLAKQHWHEYERAGYPDIAFQAQRCADLAEICHKRELGNRLTGDARSMGAGAFLGMIVGMSSIALAWLSTTESTYHGPSYGFLGILGGLSFLVGVPFHVYKINTDNRRDRFRAIARYFGHVEHAPLQG